MTWALSTDEVREAYILAADTTNADRDNGEDFDHWLAGVIGNAQAEAFEAAWWSSGEGFNGEYPDEGVPWESSAGREAYTRWVEQNSEGNET